MLDRPSPLFTPIAPPARSTILRPGIRALEPGVERYRVEGARTIVVDLKPGDRIAVADVEGGRASQTVHRVQARTVAPIPA